MKMESGVVLINIFVLSMCLFDADAFCDGKITKKVFKDENEVEYISTPDYPYNNYNNNMVCRWVFDMKSSMKEKTSIQFELLDMTIQSPSGSRCLDYVSIYMGYPSTSAVLLDRFCGTGSDKEYEIEKGVRLFVEFRSDGNITSKGFNAKITVNKEKDSPLSIILPATLVPSGIIVFCVFCHLHKKRELAKNAKAKAEADKKAKSEANKNTKAEADKKAKAEADTKAKAEADKKAKEEAEKKEKEEAEKKAKNSCPIGTQTDAAISCISSGSNQGATGGPSNPHVVIVHPRQPLPSLDALYSYGTMNYNQPATYGLPSVEMTNIPPPPPPIQTNPPSNTVSPPPYSEKDDCGV